jgi:hypothetical protein
MNNNDTYRSQEAMRNAVEQAARTLIGLVKRAEYAERRGAEKAELDLSVDLTNGGTETWTITIERKAP